MQYRTLGKTGWNVSAVSLGCWGIGGQWGPVEETEAIRTMQHAMECGVNLLDTADSYGSCRVSKPDRCSRGPFVGVVETTEHGPCTHRATR